MFSLLFQKLSLSFILINELIHKALTYLNLLGGT